MQFISENRERFGVEPMCRVLSQHGVRIAPSTYYAARHRGPSVTAVRDAELTERIQVLHAENYGVYGYRKVWHALNRQGPAVGRGTVARLMGRADLRGVSRGRTTRTTRPAPAAAGRPADLLRRDFTATAPNRAWVADITYVWTFTGFIYVALVTDLFSRRIVGWRADSRMRTDLALDALEHALFSRNSEGQSTTGAVHHSDRGSQYLSIRYSERLAEAGLVASVGSVGDSYDNAAAESVNGLLKTELVRHRGPWRNLDHFELALSEWVDWYNQQRLHGWCGQVPPAEYEHQYYRDRNRQAAA